MYVSPLNPEVSSRSQAYHIAEGHLDSAINRHIPTKVPDSTGQLVDSYTPSLQWNQLENMIVDLLISNKEYFDTQANLIERIQGSTKSINFDMETQAVVMASMINKPEYLRLQSLIAEALLKLIPRVSSETQQVVVDAFYVALDTFSKTLSLNVYQGLLKQESYLSNAVKKNTEKILSRLAESLELRASTNESAQDDLINEYLKYPGKKPVLHTPKGEPHWANDEIFPARKIINSQDQTVWPLKTIGILLHESIFLPQKYLTLPGFHCYHGFRMKTFPSLERFLEAIMDIGYRKVVVFLPSSFFTDFSDKLEQAASRFPNLLIYECDAFGSSLGFLVQRFMELVNHRRGVLPEAKEIYAYSKLIKSWVFCNDYYPVMYRAWFKPLIYSPHYTLPVLFEIVPEHKIIEEYDHLHDGLLRLQKRLKRQIEEGDFSVRKVDICQYELKEEAMFLAKFIKRISPKSIVTVINLNGFLSREYGTHLSIDMG